jgi:hypothetical protein
MAKNKDIWEFEIIANERNMMSFKKPNTWFRLDTAMIHTAKWSSLSLGQQALWIAILSHGAAQGRLRVSFRSSVLVSFCRCKGNNLPRVVRGLIDNQWIRIVRSPDTSSTNERTNVRTDTSSDSVESSPAISLSPKQEPETQEVLFKKRDQAERVLEAWNMNCGNCRKAKELNKKRKARCLAIIDKYSIEQIAKFAFEIGNNQFCSGNNDRGWTADFDYFIRESTLIKAEEGGFKNVARSIGDVHREIADAF